MYPYELSVSVSSDCLRLGVILLSPFSQHDLSGARVGLLKNLLSSDAIGAEMAIPVTQFAPSHHDAELFEISERKRPDDTLTGCIVLIAVVDKKFALLANALSNGLQINLLLVRWSGRSDQQARIIQFPA